MTSRHSDLFGPRSDRARQGLPMGRVALVVIALLVIGGLIYLATLFGMVMHHITDPIEQAVLPDVRPAPVQVGQRINILVLGVDDEGTRTDSIWLVSVDPDTKKAGVVAIPRDTRALLAGKGTVEKINGAYAYGLGDKQFPANLRALKTVENLLEVRIHYTVTVGLDGFRKAIDEVGGVWVDIPHAMEYDDPDQDLHIRFEPGRQKLDGKQALEFVRWRKNNDGTGYPDGDLGRIRAQQQFIKNLMDQVLRPGNLLNLGSLALTVARHVDTTLEPSRITQLAGLAASVRKEDVEFATLPGTTANLYDQQEGKHLNFFLIDPEASGEMVDRLIRGIEPAAAAGIQVVIAMADSADDAEVQLRRRLSEHGFAVSDVARSGPRPDTTQVISPAGDLEKGRLVGRALTSLGYEVDVLTWPQGATDTEVTVIPGRNLSTH